MQRIAAPMIGGMITAPLLSMFVIPAAYYLMKRRSLESRSLNKPLSKEKRNETFACNFNRAACFLGAAPLASAQMKGMDMKDMDMKGMKSDKKAEGQVHKGTGVVTNIDRAGARSRSSTSRSRA